MSKVNGVLWCLVVALVAMHWLPNMFTRGIFLDGVINGLVAENLSKGWGSFFHLKGFECFTNDYHGHPPLVFQLQSYFFYLMNNGFYAEKVYSFFCVLVQLVLISVVWMLAADSKSKNMVALPLLFFLIVPIVSWAYSSNLLENTMSLFTSAVVVWVLAHQKGKIPLMVAVLFSSVCLIAGLLCKGPVALFVLAAPVLLLQDKQRAAVFTALLIVCTTVLTLLVYWAFPEFGLMLSNYFRAQIEHSFSLKHQQFWQYFGIWKELLFQLALAGLLVVFLYFIGGRKIRPMNRSAISFLLLGLCGSLPIAISFKQSTFYLIPSVPYFAVGFALYCADDVTLLLQKTRSYFQKGILYTSATIVAACVVLGAYNYGSYLRDENMIEDAKIIAGVAEEKCIEADADVLEQWHFRAYLYRYHKVALSPHTNENPSGWVIKKAGVSVSENEYIAYSGKVFSLISTDKQ